MDDVRLLKKSGYSEKAIEYYLKKTNVGHMDNSSAHLAYTGPCGDTIEIYLKIESNIIKDVKFQANGCVGSFSSRSALMEMVKGKSLEEAERLTEDDIFNFLEGMPEQKFHCACLAKRTLKKVIEKYRNINSSKITCSIKKNLRKHFTKIFIKRH